MEEVHAVVIVSLPTFDQVDPLSIDLGLTRELFDQIVINGRWYLPPDDPLIFKDDLAALGNCFGLAWHTAAVHAGVEYIQGLALAVKPGALWTHHAWNVVSGDGRVLDLTWGTGQAYYGTSVKYSPGLYASLKSTTTPLTALLLAASRSGT